MQGAALTIAGKDTTIFLVYKLTKACQTAKNRIQAAICLRFVMRNAYTSGNGAIL